MNSRADRVFAGFWAVLVTEGLEPTPEVELFLHDIVEALSEEFPPEEEEDEDGEEE